MEGGHGITKTYYFIIVLLSLSRNSLKVENKKDVLFKSYLEVITQYFDVKVCLYFVLTALAKFMISPYTRNLSKQRLRILTRFRKSY